ncbi:MAG TPA: GIY-YIG nuclease family protein [Geobacteraceae bacterium]|nr:GIY-YIG nuclease family protein [Geobacteraceae bacterium]
MKYVYLIRSRKAPAQTYVGLTHDVHKRLAAHNAGQSSHTSKYAPWELVAFFGFAERGKAAAFEEYVKSGSGRAFAFKRFW